MQVSVSSSTCYNTNRPNSREIKRKNANLFLISWLLGRLTWGLFTVMFQQDIDESGDIADGHAFNAIHVATDDADIFFST